MKKLVAIVALLGLFSCNNEEVLLPQENVSVLKEMTDHSPIYMFFKTLRYKKYNQIKEYTIHDYQ